MSSEPDDPEEAGGRRPGEERTYSAEDVRGGEIILRTRTRRIVFIGGLVGLVLLALILRFASLA
jgi:hypothetical protein